MSRLKQWVGNYDGRRRGLVQASSKKRAAELVRCSVYAFGQYWHEIERSADFLPETLYTTPIDGGVGWTHGKCDLPGRALDEAMTQAGKTIAVAVEPEPEPEPEPPPPSLEERFVRFGRALRSAAYWIDDGYYSTESERAVSSAKRSIYEEIASALDSAFDVDSSLPGGRP